MRQQFRVDIPMRRHSHLQWILGTEPFFNLRETDWADSGFVQNRAFAGLGIPLCPKVRVEAGYMNQWLKIRGREDLVNHILIVNFKFR